MIILTYIVPQLIQVKHAIVITEDEHYGYNKYVIIIMKYIIVITSEIVIFTSEACHGYHKYSTFQK